MIWIIRKIISKQIEQNLNLESSSNSAVRSFGLFMAIDSMAPWKSIETDFSFKNPAYLIDDEVLGLDEDVDRLQLGIVLGWTDRLKNQHLNKKVIIRKLFSELTRKKKNVISSFFKLFTYSPFYTISLIFESLQNDNNYFSSHSYSPLKSD